MDFAVWPSRYFHMPVVGDMRWGCVTAHHVADTQQCLKWGLPDCTSNLGRSVPKHGDRKEGTLVHSESGGQCL